ncbi:MAG TPA: hypothetical protein PKL65_00190 [Bacteroidales bacterium]|nr:hypothetical protein [Bacteroidales bacterium]HNR40622.1 hypothetical protein [Bacteroidales bacterium]HPM18098.1 hypothetical protein [Bacteroidales bacterium]HQG77282.1 hypothetical protein [Bacteroidales bacterium]
MKNAVFLILLLTVSLAASAQETDFSGKWKLNTGKSKLNEDFSSAPFQVVITQDGNDMTIERHQDFRGETSVMTDKYTLDGKECQNKAFMESVKTSTAKWSEDGKSLKVSSKIVQEDGNETIITEIFKFDGDNLVIDYVRAVFWGETEETFVFDRI